MRILNLILLLSLLIVAISCGKNPPEPYGPLPTKQQVEWQKMETNMFMHFGPNTFTGKEWGDGTEIEDLFCPSVLDCNQWATIAKNAGFGGIIITAKHHDGFCLWPNPESEHTVAQSSWRDGKGDVLRELSDACAKTEIKFGVYISPWDRNAPTYGTAEYNITFLNTLQSALSNYGPIFEQWFDGACGEGPNGKRQVYDWCAFNNKVYELQPNAVIFSDVGPGCRWVGNEKGEAGRTSWSRLDIEGFGPGSVAPSQDTLNIGNVHGNCWIPSETDVSIRTGWFYRDSEHPKSLQELLKIYYTSVGRNSLLLLNVPPDQRGLIAAEDSIRLMEFRQALNDIFANDLAQNAEFSADNERGRKFSAKNLQNADYDSYWATDDDVLDAVITIDFATPQTFNRIMLQEYIPLGQRVSAFHVEALAEDGTWRTIASETTIGYKRILLVDDCTTESLRICIDSSFACPVLNKVALYFDNVFDNIENR